MLKLVSLVFRNITRNRRRSILTLASTAISLSVLGLLVALYQGFFFAPAASPSEALRLITRHKVSLTQVLPISHEVRIRSVEGVAAVSTWSWFGGQYIDDRPENFIAQFAVEPETAFEVHKDYIVPPEQLAAFKHNRTGCAVGKKIADAHKLKIGDRITLMGRIYPVNLELTVDAIFTHPENAEALLFNNEYLTELRKAKSADSKADTTGTFAIIAKSAEDVPHIARAIDTMFADSPNPTKTETEREFSLSFMSFLGNIKLYLGVMCAAVTFTILLVSANTVAMSVRERVREMAILRTLGFSPTEIIQLILGESVVLALIGGLIGVFATYLLTHAAAAGAGPWGEAIKFHWQACAVVCVFAVVIGLVSAVIPAFFASRRGIVDSLRFTG